jgi:Zn-finger nucleic acid-binding protein
MLCPRCGVLLNELTKVGVVVDVCDRCRGMWMDRGELEKIVAELRSLEREEAVSRGRAYHEDARRHREDRPGGRFDDDDDVRDGRRQGTWSRLLEFFD